ncbi:MAG TPA: hypothetical protein PK198_17875, partial [Saprospiraceae bacterium]|nr:hypothetical protein [Saprospiraceae bacterium]
VVDAPIIGMADRDKLLDIAKVPAIVLIDPKPERLVIALFDAILKSPPTLDSAFNPFKLVSAGLLKIAKLPSIE